MEFGPLFIAEGIAQEAHNDTGFMTEILGYLRRYQLGDWGDLYAKDAQLNKAVLRSGVRIMSIYAVKRGGKVWIIAEAANENGQRAATTVLFPNEY